MKKFLEFQIWTAIILSAIAPRSFAQVPAPLPAPDFQRIPQPQPQPQPQESPLPPPEELLQSPPSSGPQPELNPGQLSETIQVERFEITGSTVFKTEELAEVVKSFVGNPISFAQLLQASEAITQKYVKAGYVTSGAFIPANQTFKQTGAVVNIQVIEGSLEGIEVSNLDPKRPNRLNPNYIRRRIEVSVGKPLNLDRLLRTLQVLQLDPLVKNISAELSAGTRPGTSILDVKFLEAEASSFQITLDNNRAPSVGSFQRQAQLNAANFSGIGDRMNFTFSNTEGSNNFDIGYTIPVNPRNGTLQLSYSRATSRVIEEPFDTLDINGKSQDFSFTFRQPILQTPTSEVALGITAQRRESDIGFLESLTGERSPFPSPGADAEGKTKLSVLRFFQEWTQRSSKQVIAMRSQFNWGVDVFNPTINDTAPDGKFFSWQGQAQWVRALAPDASFLLRAEGQLSDRTLVPLEQFGLGGQRTVRGYRQDFLLVDNAFFASAEVRLPILRAPKLGGILQLTPFVDFGLASNREGRDAPELSSISSIGLGLLWTSQNVTARFDWGIPLRSIEADKNTLQEKGLYFSVSFTQPFR
jgi:hemolysin activation/secretion protein